MLDRIRSVWTTEPARLVAALAAVVVFVAAKLGLVIDRQSVGEALLLVLPILLGGEATRAKVTPAAGDVGPASDALLGDEARRAIDAHQAG